jgi:hypothetical protein
MLCNAERPKYTSRTMALIQRIMKDLLLSALTGLPTLSIKIWEIRGDTSSWNLGS